MSDENADSQLPPGQPPSPPNWGSAYPPPVGQYPPPGYPQFSQLPPKHENATTSLVLGIVALAGFFLCYITIFLAPIAWFLGAKAVREIDANPHGLSGRSEANAGKIMGIIGTVLMVLSLIALAGLLVLLLTSASFAP